MKTASVLLIVLNVAGVLAAKGPEQFRWREAETLRQGFAECPRLQRTYGCDQNYCWRICGREESDQWCWQAEDGGYGPWISCSSHEDCSLDNLLKNHRDHGCGIGKDCSACGCGC